MSKKPNLPESQPTLAKRLLAFDEPALEQWIEARFRREQADPPLSDRGEEPFDAVKSLCDTSPELKPRIGRAVERLLRTALDRGSFDESGLREFLLQLLFLTRWANLQEPFEPLAILMRHQFRGERATDLELRSRLLTAIAKIQPRGVLTEEWTRVWNGSEPTLWGTAFAGLRRANPEAALAELPKALDRAKAQSEFPLPEILWALLKDRNVPTDQRREIVSGIPHRHAQIRTALSQIGASEEDIAQFLGEDTAQHRAVPAFAAAWSRSNHYRAPVTVFQSAAA